MYSEHVKSLCTYVWVSADATTCVTFREREIFVGAHFRKNPAGFAQNMYILSTHKQ